MKFCTKNEANEALATLRAMKADSGGQQVQETLANVECMAVMVKHLTISQLKRILIVLLKEKQLLATDYVDLGSVTLPVFLDSFRKILDAIGMNGA